MNRPNKPESFQARKEFPDEIDRSQPYELCQYFANEQQPLARYTYIIYKEEKIKWITTFKRDHVREPTQEEKNNQSKREFSKAHCRLLQGDERKRQNGKLLYQQKGNNL